MGFGKTGKAVATVLLNDKSVNLVWVVRKSHKLEHRSVPEFLGIESDEEGVIHSSVEISADELLDQYPVDAIVDFSSEEGLEYYGETAAARGISIISAISSYPDGRHKELKELAKTTRVLWSPNITLGINFMILAAKTLQSIAPYADLQIVEEHFKSKPETSGTALKIADSLGLDPDEIKTIRAGGIIGVHEILFGFPFQTVRLRHESITREAFGNGAKFALIEIAKREIGLYRMEDLIGNYFVESNREYLAEEGGMSQRPKNSGILSRLKDFFR